MPPSRKPLSEAFGEPFLEPQQTLYELFQDIITKFSARTALVSMHQPPSFLQSVTQSPPAPYLRWTFEELSRASHSFAQALAAADIRPGMRIVTFVLNGAEVWVTFLACLELNCTFIPLNPKTISNLVETNHILSLSEPSVLVLQDAIIAEKLEMCVPEITKRATVKLLSAKKQPTSITPQGWRDFASFVEDVPRDDTLARLEITRRLDDIIIMVFTSGTTSLPKGCPHTNKTFSAMCLSWAVICDFEPTRVACVHIPLFHLFAFSYAVMFFLSGLKAVHPAAAFDPSATLRAIQLERVSDLPGVAAIFYAILAHPEMKNTDTSCLKHASLGASVILPETVRACIEELGALKASEGFGMSECGPVLMHRYRDIPNHTGKVTAGRPIPGCVIRICDPTTGQIVGINEPGELHVGFAGVLERYWLSPSQGEGANSIFYKEGDLNWMSTGDQALMNEEGNTKIIGRYKDMIIRGGENISPTAIESLLSSRFGLVAEVIGIPDEFAGEVPVAVLPNGNKSSLKPQLIKETLIRELGTGFGLDDIIHLESLGLQDYPRTSSGKVKKNELREIIRNTRQHNGSPQAGGDILQTLSRLWSKVLGVSPETLTPLTSMNDWADSLTLARFAAVLSREASLSITLQELLENDTLEAQAKLLSSRHSKSHATFSFDICPNREGPPRIEDMAHAHGDVERFQKTKEMCKQSLAPLGLGWNDVEDVIPMTDVNELFLTKRRPQSGNHRHSILCPGSSIETVDIALRKALTRHPILRTMAVYFDSETSFHVAVRPTTQWFSHCISLIDPVNTAEDLHSFKLTDNEFDFVSYPGPMLRFGIAYVRTEGCVGIVYLGQHSVFDATSFPMFLEDLDNFLITTKATMEPRVPFKAWADSFYSLKYSASAREAINWNRKRLSGIGLKSMALFPAQKSPQWFKGDSTGWTATIGKPGPVRKSLDTNPTGAQGMSMQCSLPDILALKREYSVEASQLVKAALAMVNTRHTNEQVAMFNQTQAGRTWPFLADWQNERMPLAMEINGPTLTRILNKIVISPNETVLHLLQNLQDEQHLLTKYSAAPTKALVAALNEGGTRDGDMWHEAMRRQEFNWLPSTNTMEYKKLKGLRISGWEDLGILWNCKMVDRTTLDVNMTWDDAQLRRVEAEKFLGELMEFAEALARMKNWEKTLAEFILSR